jgi:hypothetical protein
VRSHQHALRAQGSRQVQLATVRFTNALRLSIDHTAMSARWHNRMVSRPTLAAGLALAVFAAHASCPIITQFDSRWVIPTAVSLLTEGNADLDEYADVIAADDYGIRVTNGHRYNSFPLGVSLVALPFVALADGFVRLTGPLAAQLPVIGSAWADWRTGLAPAHFNRRFFATIEMVTASALVGITTAWLWLLLVYRRGVSHRAAFAAALAFAFATPAWSTASRALWQHAPSMLCVVGTWWCLSRKPTPSGWAGAWAAAGFVMRPTNAWLVVCAFGVIAWSHRRGLWAALACAALVASPYAWVNFAQTGLPIEGYALPSRLGSPDRLQALAANLVSPNRGLFVFTPILSAAIWAWVKRLRSGPTPLEVAAMLFCLAHWVTVSSFPHWWAGHSFGPRFMTDVVPILVWCAAPFIEAWPAVARRLAVAVTILSAAVHLRAATSWAPWGWNDGPPNVDDDPTRVWDWRHPQWWPEGAWSQVREPDTRPRHDSFASGSLSLSDVTGSRCTAWSLSGPSTSRDAE